MVAAHVASDDRTSGQIALTAFVQCVSEMTFRELLILISSSAIMRPTIGPSFVGMDVNKCPPSLVTPSIRLPAICPSRLTNADREGLHF
jgi:hypothetical protein